VPARAFARSSDAASNISRLDAVVGSPRSHDQAGSGNILARRRRVFRYLVLKRVYVSDWPRNVPATTESFAVSGMSRESSRLRERLAYVRHDAGRSSGHRYR